MEEQEYRDMNLFDLIRWCCCGIGRFVKKCGVSVLHLVRFSVQNIWIILAFVVVFVGLGIYFTQWKNTKFRGGATILFVEEASPTIHDYMQRLDVYSRSPRMFSHLNMPDTLLKKISKIESYSWIDCKHDGMPDFVNFYDDKQYQSDTSDVIMNDRLFVRIEAKGLYDMACIQEWLQNYFDAQPELTALSEQGRQVLRMKLDTYDREIARLDSLSNYEYFKQESSTKTEVQNGVMVTKGKSLYYNDILNLIRKRGQVEAQLNQRTHNINFQNDIVVTSASPRLVRLFFWLLAGYVFGALTALAINRRKEICAYMSRK